MPLTVDNLKNLSAALTSAAIIIAGLILGRDVFVPLALAGIFCFVLSPIVRWLSVKIPRVAATIIVVVMVSGTLAGLAVALSSEVLNLAGSLPSYKYNFTQKIRDMVGSSATSGAFTRITDAIALYDDILSKELKSASKPNAPGGSPDEKQVILAKSESETAQNIARLAAIAPTLVQVALTFLLTLFLLIQYPDLRDRVVRVVGTDNISGTTAAMSETSERLSKLFFAQAIINGVFALTVGCCLYLIGVPNAPLWAVTSFVARFVPFIGSFAAAIPPILLSMAVDPNWTMAIFTIGLFLIGEPLTGNVVEPIFLGKSAGLSPLAMVLSASFWTIVWGPVGLLLAAPLTMMIVVLGRYVPSLEFLSVLLGDDEALTPSQEFYHRVLSGDALSANEQVDDARQTLGEAAIGDEIILPGLHLAAIDYRKGRLAEPALKEFRETMTEVLDGSYPEDVGVLSDDIGHVLIVPGRGPVDEILAAVVTRLLAHGNKGTAFAAGSTGGLLALSAYKSDPRNTTPSRIAIVSSGILPINHLDFIGRKAKAMFPSSKIVVMDVGSASQEFHDHKRNDGIIRLSKLQDLIASCATISRAA